MINEVVNKVKNKFWKFFGKESFELEGYWTFECFDPNGNLKWKEEGKNLVVTAGLNHILDVEFNGTTQDTTWFIGLKNAGTVAAGDTLASHAGWAENVNYTGNRKAYTTVSAAAGVITNTASKASFAIDTDSQTIAGGFLATVDTGTSGILFNARDFTGGNKSADSGDTLEVTLSITGSSS